MIYYSRMLPTVADLPLSLSGGVLSFVFVDVFDRHHGDRGSCQVSAEGTLEHG